MTPDEQYAAIHQASFFTDLRTKLKNTISSMATAEMKLEGDDPWLRTNVSGVPFAFRQEADNDHVRVGISSEGKPFYELIIPKEWIN